MEESILNEIKKLLGIDVSNTSFDKDLIICINTCLSILTQKGIGPEEGLVIADQAAKWSDFIGTNTLLIMVKSYIHLKVKLIFDPPSSSVVVQSMDNILKELDARIQMEADKPVSES